MKLYQGKSFYLLLFYMTILSCQGPQFGVIENMTNNALDAISCGEVKTLFLDDYKKILLDEGTLPEKNEILKSFEKLIKQKELALDESKKEELTVLMADWLNLIDEAYLSNNQLSSIEKVIEISSFDVEDETNQAFRFERNKKRELYTKLENVVSTLNLDCPGLDNGTPGGSDEFYSSPLEFGRERATYLNKEWATYGAQLVMATTYQSCQSLQTNKLTQRTPAIEGIEVVGRHSNQVGLKREVVQLSRVQKTHPYLPIESERARACYDTYLNPPIYDYGGKPYLSGSNRDRLDMHTNAGSGTQALGIDCSGFVFSSLATMGLKLQESRPLKALDVYSWNAKSYMFPEKSGMSCMSRVATTAKALDSGWLLANDGHILMIDEIGKDPWGISYTKNIQDCNKINSSHFDFSIIQSSSSKGGIGINRYKASDYFTPSLSMTPGIVSYQRAFCRSHYSKKVESIGTTQVSLVRHLKEKSSCLAPRVVLENEKCLADCSIL